MKVYEEKHIPARVDKYMKCVTCDYCGKQGKYGWYSSRYNHDETKIEVTIKHEAGHHYPEGSTGQRFATDMCPDCFNQKLIPFVLSIALPEVKLDYEDYDI